MKSLKNTVVAESGSFTGSLFSAFCPACVPVIGTFLTAIGLGALVNFKLLSILTLVFLIIGMIGLFLNFRYHKNGIFLAIGMLASTAVYAGRYNTNFTPLIYLGAVILIGNAVFDYRTLKICKKCTVKK